MVSRVQAKKTFRFLLGASLSITMLAGCKPSPKESGPGVDSSRTDSLQASAAPQVPDAVKPLDAACEMFLKRLDSLVVPLPGELERNAKAIAKLPDSLSKDAALLDLQASWGKFDSLAIGVALASPEYLSCAVSQTPPYDDTIFTGRATAILYRGGLTIVSEEGMVSAVPALHMRSDLLNPALTTASRQFLKLSFDEASNKADKDAGIVIPIVDLAARMVSWDSLASAYPASPLAAAAKGRAAACLRMLLVGEDNTPAFENGQAVDAFRDAWKSAAARPVQGPSHQILKDWYAQVSKSNFRHTGKTRAWLKQQGIDGSGDRSESD
ncbi:MAG: hypothetical protein RL318_1944 [Fibrobacterota bacterium]|jgi:hypothetical protein